MLLTFHVIYRYNEEDDEEMDEAEIERQGLARQLAEELSLEVSRANT